MAQQPITLDAESFCSQYAAAVCQFAALLARNGADAEDLAQETLVRAIAHLDRFDPDRGQAEAWLWRIAANVAADYRRAEKRRISLLSWLVRQAGSSPLPENEAVTRLESEEVRQAIRRLPRREALLIALRFGADLDLKTVGATLGISQEAARKAVSRTLARLRSELGGSCED